MFSTAIAQTSTSDKGLSPLPEGTEERLVRLAYNKLSVYNMASKVREGKRFTESTAQSLKFNLSNFKTGSITDLENTKYVDVVSSPTDEIILLTRNVVEPADSAKQDQMRTVFTAKWSPGKFSTFFDRNWTIRDLLRIEVDKYYDVEKYVSYDVAVTFEGKSRNYRALVLVHGPLENLKLEFLDAVTGIGGNLTSVWREQFVPFGLKNGGSTGQATQPTHDDLRAKVMRFLSSLEVSKTANTETLSCNAGATGLKQCCIDGALGAFWGIESCSAWSEEVAEVKAEDESSQNLADIQFRATDGLYHIGGGYHWGRARFRPLCSSVNATTQRCDVQLRDEGYGDMETDHSDIYYHVGNIAAQSRGNQGPKGQDVSCDSAVAFAFNRCLFDGCEVTLALSINGSGMGATATVEGGDLWRTAHAEGNSCNLPRSTGGGSCGSGFTITGEKYDEKQPQNVCSPCTPDPIEIFTCQSTGGTYDWNSCQCGQSPIAIDVLGNGYNLTNVAGGVVFDINGDGRQDRIAWSSANSDDAWLALDLNGNGTIDNGKELFGNSTPQPAPPKNTVKNGFLALAVYDMRAMGGNADGVINEQDEIFGSLRLWQDLNHNGISESGELKTLPELGLATISLDYKESKRTDEFGNKFRFRAKVSDASDSAIGRWAWDIYLVTQPGLAGN